MPSHLIQKNSNQVQQEKNGEEETERERERERESTCLNPDLSQDHSTTAVGTHPRGAVAEGGARRAWVQTSLSRVGCFATGLWHFEVCVCVCVFFLATNAYIHTYIHTC